MAHYPRGPNMVGLAVFCLNLCAWPLVAAFLNNPEWRAPYLLSVSVLTTLFLVVIEPRTRPSLPRFLVYAGLGGEACGVIALQIAKLFDKIDGLAAFQRPLLLVDFLASLVTIDALVAAILGGWLTAMLAAAIMRASRFYPRQERA
jgi:hypothetical protein